jgi:Rieske Fe-S protein
MVDPNRRSLLKWCIHGLSALFAAILGIPAVAFLIDGRNRAVAQGDLRTVAGVRRGDLVKNVPVQGVIRAVRRDAWTLHPNDVIGRVWVVKLGDGAGLADYQIFTTVCPHLGCSINSNPDPSTGFTCPCHDGQFHCNGTKVAKAGYENPAPRGMDSLAFEFDSRDPDVFLVRYQNFYQARADKTPRT